MDVEKKKKLLEVSTPVDVEKMKQIETPGDGETRRRARCKQPPPEAPSQKRTAAAMEKPKAKAKAKKKGKARVVAVDDDDDDEYDEAAHQDLPQDEVDSKHGGGGGGALGEEANDGGEMPKMIFWGITNENHGIGLDVAALLLKVVADPHGC